ncbi:MAG: YjjG family noncanonical pyrimidine nucleotidase [Clostridia bacterium]|nr:YjjG family noncanonical pyrimidine nucleotidase [Clostridia bacterium]
MLKNVKYVLLDVDNTLLDFNAGAEKAALKAFEAFGLDAAKYDHATFRRLNDALWAALERGEITREQIHKTRWNIIFEALGVEGDGEAFEHEFLAQILTSVVPVEGAHELLRYLSAKYPLYVASNAPHTQQINRLKAAGMYGYFTDVFTSELFGVAKPSSAFFENALSRIEGARAEECVMIGDSLSADVKGANAFGMQTVFFDFKAEHPEVCVADEVVWSLREIKLFL